MVPDLDFCNFGCKFTFFRCPKNGQISAILEMLPKMTSAARNQQNNIFEQFSKILGISSKIAEVSFWQRCLNIQKRLWDKDVDELIRKTQLVYNPQANIYENFYFEIKVFKISQKWAYLVLPILEMWLEFSTNCGRVFCMSK